MRQTTVFTYGVCVVCVCGDFCWRVTLVCLRDGIYFIGCCQSTEIPPKREQETKKKKAPKILEQFSHTKKMLCINRWNEKVLFAFVVVKTNEME